MRKWSRLAIISGILSLACIMVAGVLAACSSRGDDAFGASSPSATSPSATDTSAPQSPDAPPVSDVDATPGVGDSTASSAADPAPGLASDDADDLDPDPTAAPSSDPTATLSPDPAPAQKPATAPTPKPTPIAVLSDYEPFMGQIFGFALLRADKDAQYELEATHLAGRLPTFRVKSRFLSLVPIPPQSKPGKHTLSVIAISDGEEEVLFTIPYTVQKVTYERQNIRVPAETAAIRTDDNLRLDNIKVSAAKSSTSSVPLWDGVFIQPVEGRISTQFAQERYTNGVYTSRHSAIDIAAPQGTPIKAAASGRVIFAGELIVSGNTVIIDHGLWLSSTYLHMSKILVSVGDDVGAGDIIGEVGSTGYSTGPHLHYSVDVRSQRAHPDMMKEKSPLDFGVVKYPPMRENTKPAR